MQDMEFVLSVSQIMNIQKCILIIYNLYYRSLTGYSKLCRRKATLPCQVPFPHSKCSCQLGKKPLWRILIWNRSSTLVLNGHTDIMAEWIVPKHILLPCVSELTHDSELDYSHLHSRSSQPFNPHVMDPQALGEGIY